MEKKEKNVLSTAKFKSAVTAELLAVEVAPFNTEN